MSKPFLPACLFALVLSACAQDWSRQGSSTAQLDMDKAHCQAIALTNLPPLMRVKTPARSVPAKTQCAPQSSGGTTKMVCSEFPSYTVPATEVDANLKPRTEAFNACMLAMNYVAPARVPEAGLFAKIGELEVNDVIAVSNRREQSALLAAQQAPDAQSARPGQWIKDCEQCPALVLIPPGSFKMGGAGSPDEQPFHRVNVAAFFMGRYEVTQAEWFAVMGSNPSANKSCGDNCPVERISWLDAQIFVKKLSARTGKLYRLPTEAEWEYAARAGSRAEWSFGNDDSQLKQYAWFNDNSKGVVHPIGLKQPNPFGLHDMHGNVWEWVEDAFHADYSRASLDGKPLQANSDQCMRVLRGGSWYNNPKDLRVSKRNPNPPDESYVFFGLRVARSL